MQQSSDSRKITFLAGSEEILGHMPEVPAKKPFCEEIVEFLNDLSKRLMSIPDSRRYPDVITFGFFLRKASVLQLKKRFYHEEIEFQFGRGVAFHIAPSNVPVNFAYSLIAGLLSGNANIVRVPSKSFEQIDIIAGAITESLKSHKEIEKYICLVRYERDKEINDRLSALCDTRIIWGGDRTIEEIRKSPLPPSSTEITFADRYSLAVIDSDRYLMIENKDRIAEDFYNDTFLSDQNACTSPRVVVWMGEKKEEAKKVFWSFLHDLAEKKYAFQPVQAVNKLTSAYLVSAVREAVKVEERKDNLIFRVQISDVDAGLMELKDNSGYFFEYDCDDLLNIKELCNDKKCQTIGYIGEKEMFLPLLNSGIKGVDRVVPIGKTMDFDLLWDGYDLIPVLTRKIAVL